MTPGEDERGGEQKEEGKGSAVNVRCLISLALVLAVLILISCTPRPVKKAVIPVSSGKFVGSQTCEPCHAALFATHAKTRHARSLLNATLKELGELAPKAGPIPGGLNLRHDNNALKLQLPKRADGTRREVELGIAIGSGKTGQTFLVLEGEQSAEIHQSYFPALKKWHVTPGQEDLDPKLVGVTHTPETTRRCLGCHAVTSDDQPPVPERKFFGIGCESCHGPGESHLAAMAKGPGEYSVATESHKAESGEKINALCGRCHRTAEDVATMPPIAKENTNRFQPYALTLSKCFVKSKGKLTCITCHDPHADASTDTLAYEKTCRTCHDGSVKEKPVCKVNPAEKCISCHMPSRDVFQGEPKLPITMADHFIKVWKPGKLLPPGPQ